jgi:pimeloyl-ACP methyl ester carboxylesterase
MNDVVFKSPDAIAAVEDQYRRVLELWPVPKAELRVPTRQGETFVIDCGPQDAPPVILLHGAQANSAAWMFDAPLWATKFRLYAIDMIGEAGLSARVRPSLTGDAHALWLDDVFEALGLARAALVGTSLGGWLALDYAVRRPAAVAGLALICPAGIGRQKNFLLKALPLALLGRWGAYKIRELVFGPAPTEVTDEFRAFGRLMDEVGREIRPRVVTIPRLTDTQLRGLGMPVLSIVGGRDVLLDSRGTRERLERCVPHAEVVYIEEGYHYLPGQASRVMRFLEHNYAKAVDIARPR